MKKEKIPENFTPVLRFAVSSDAHIKEAGDESCRNIIKLLDRSYKIARADASHPLLDAFFLVGDSANSSETEQFEALFDVLKQAKKDETLFRGTLAKYHDCRPDRESLAYYSEKTGQPTDWHIVINGFHFIGISVSPDTTVHYSDIQKEWLAGEIEKAVGDGPEKPVFVLQHEHIRDTVYGSTLFDGWGEIYLADIVRKYPNVVDISGHSHYPATDPRAIWQGDFTALNDGGLAYFEFTYDGERKYHPENASIMAQFMLIEVSAENSVRVMVYDLHEDIVAADYFIEAPADMSKFAYKTEDRKAAATDPVFNGEISVEKTENGCVITSAPAVCSEDDAVFLYRLSVKNSEGEEVISDKCLSDYYYRSVPGKVSFSAELAKGSYSAVITAETVWEKSGTIQTEFEI